MNNDAPEGLDAVLAAMANDDSPALPEAPVENTEVEDTTSDDDAISAITGTKDEVVEEKTTVEVVEENQLEDDTKAAPVAFDVEKVKAAIEKKDPKAFVEALGDAANDLLQGKAHKALRLMVKDVQKAEKQSAEAYAKASELVTSLQKKYGDPIAARQAADEGNVDVFIDMVEKWSGRSWTDVQRWVVKGLSGRPERLTAAKQEQDQAAKNEQMKQAQAVNDAKQWITGIVKKSDAALLEANPAVVDMVFDEIRANYDKGIDSPAKAMPAVKKKLQAQYEALHKVFGKSTPATKGKAPVPASKTPSKVNTQPKTVADIIRETIAESGE